MLCLSIFNILVTHLVNIMSQYESISKIYEKDKFYVNDDGVARPQKGFYKHRTLRSSQPKYFINMHILHRNLCI